MSKFILAGVSVLACAVLGGCGGGGGGGNGGGLGEEVNRDCHTIPVHAVACTNCTQVSNVGASFDGHFSTAATLLPGGSGTFLGSSDTQTAGSVAGVSFALPQMPGVTVTIATLLDGTLQEQGQPVSRQWPNDNCSNAGPPSPDCTWRDGDDSFAGIFTTKPYNQIQATMTNSGSAAIQVKELCVR